MIKRHTDLRKEYLSSSLDEKSINADPFKQFSNWFEDAVNAEVEEPNAMVLSTADLMGNVSARVVLLREVDKGGFVFFSNYQSRKASQLESNPQAALTFHWHVPERQIRVEGKVKKITRTESVAYFNSRPYESRVSACISPQSAIIPDRSFLEAMREGFILDLNGQPPQCPDNWGGYRLKPALVEFWQGREGRLHDRLRYLRSGNKWNLERLAP